MRFYVINKKTHLSIQYKNDENLITAGQLTYSKQSSTGHELE